MSNSAVEIENFLNENNIKFKKNSSHYQACCPLCTDSRFRLGIKIEKDENKKYDHSWNCFNCSHKGKSIRTLAKAMGVLSGLKRKEFVEYKDTEKVTIDQTLGKRIFNDLKINKDAIKYLINDRGLSKECLKHFKIGFRDMFLDEDTQEEYVDNNGPYLALPYYELDKLVNIKYRSLNPNVDKSKKWKREKGGKTALFNNDIVYDLEIDTIYIAESEIDCMSMWCNGYKNSVGLTAGAKNFKQEWYDKLERFKKIYLVLDNDQAGQEGAKKLAKRLGLHRCYNVLLPEDIKDPNDFFLKYKKEDFEALKAKAGQFDVEKAVTLAKAVDQKIRRLETGDIKEEGLLTQWPKINTLVKIFKPGNLVVVAAKPKVGKSTFIMNWLNYLAVEQGIASFNYQCELDEEDMVDKYALMNNKYDPDLMPEDKDSEEYKEWVAEQKRKLRTLKIIVPKDKLISFHPTMEDLELEKIVDKVKEVVQRFGTDVVVIDNLHFICRGDNAKEKIDIATRTFKSLAMTLGVVVVVITHPRKTNHNKALTNDDLKDSSSIFQDADFVILMHRAYKDNKQENHQLDEEDEEEEDSSFEEEVLEEWTEIKVTARRAKGGVTNLVYLGDSGLFKDSGLRFDKIKMDRLSSKKNKETKKKSAELQSI